LPERAAHDAGVTLVFAGAVGVNFFISEDAFAAVAPPNGYFGFVAKPFL